MAPRRSEDEEGMTRRSFLKGGVVGGVVGAAGVGTYATLRSLVAPERQQSGVVNEAFIYAPPLGAELPIWYEDLVGEEALLEDFDVGQGAAVGWRSITDESGNITFPGFPAQLIRMDETILEVPEGFPREEFLLDGIFGIFNTCTHAGCPPGWGLLPPEKYVPEGDPNFPTIYCECHWSQYDPRRLAAYQHPPPPEASGAPYFGVFKIPNLGPAPRGMPLIPLELDGSRILGKVHHSDWYQYLTWKGVVIPEDEA